ncbi:hypothetical protein ACTWQF_10380 [Streptomyces sp. 8N114]|uniref:hypothetical protein n=1 Tax=Streptomyces sp. 8N114 TaxID=3457419 RepID=UPI003FD298D2
MTYGILGGLEHAVERTAAEPADEDDLADLTPEAQREFVIRDGPGHDAGRPLGHRMVEMPGPDGSPGFAIVAASAAADDPAPLEEIREDLHRWAAERAAIDASWTGSPEPARAKPTEGLGRAAGEVFGCRG